MDSDHDRCRNQAAFRRMQAALANAYGEGQFLAIAGGRVIADAETFAALRSRVQSLGIDPSHVLVVQAGTEYPESAVIFRGSRHP
jgi:hypothetical protein